MMQCSEVNLSVIQTVRRRQTVVYLLNFPQDDSEFRRGVREQIKKKNIQRHRYTSVAQFEM